MSNKIQKETFSKLETKLSTLTNQINEKNTKVRKVTSLTSALSYLEIWGVVSGINEVEESDIKYIEYTFSKISGETKLNNLISNFNMMVLGEKNFDLNQKRALIVSIIELCASSEIPLFNEESIISMYKQCFKCKKGESMHNFNRKIQRHRRKVDILKVMKLPKRSLLDNLDFLLKFLEYIEAEELSNGLSEYIKDKNLKTNRIKESISSGGNVLFQNTFLNTGIEKQGSLSFFDFIAMLNEKQVRMTISAYQRPYKWDVSLINGLLRSIKHADSQNGKFLSIGDMYFASKGKKSDIYDIADGQQRITTVCILATVLTDTIYKMSLEDENYKALLSEWKGKFNNISLSDMFELSQESKFSPFIAILDGDAVDIKEDNVYSKAYDIIKSYVEQHLYDDESLIEFINNFGARTIFSIEINYEKSGQEIFRTLNSGANKKSLTYSEIIKGIMYDSIAHEEILKHEGRFMILFEDIDKATSDKKFLNTMLYVNEYDGDKGHEAFISDVILNSQKGLSFTDFKNRIRTFLEFVYTYHLLFKGEKLQSIKDEISFSKHDIQNIELLSYEIHGVKAKESTTPLLMKVVYDYMLLQEITVSEAYYIIKEIEYLAEIDYINNTEKSLGRITKLIKPEMLNSLENVHKAYRNFMFNDTLDLSYSSFKEKMKILKFKSSNRDSFIHFELLLENFDTLKNNRVNDGNISHVLRDFKDKTVEHIIPQSAFEQGYKDKKDEYMDNVGNLMLISQSANSSISDGDVDDKKIIYSKIKEKGINNSTVTVLEDSENCGIELINEVFNYKVDKWYEILQFFNNRIYTNE